MTEDKKSCCIKKGLMLLITWPESVASHFKFLGPLVARLVVGYVFMLTGWEKLGDLAAVTKNFAGWGIPYPEILTPFVAGVECFGGLLLMLGLFTRIAGSMLSGVMLVAIISAKLMDIDSLETLLGFEEASYFAIFFWLALNGAGKVSLDHLLCRKCDRTS